MLICVHTCGVVITLFRITEVNRTSSSNEKQVGELSSSESDDLERIEVPKKPQWDCESVLSTYSNLYNHPTKITEPTPQKVGFPITFLTICTYMGMYYTVCTYIHIDTTQFVHTYRYHTGCAYIRRYHTVCTYVHIGTTQSVHT